MIACPPPPSPEPMPDAVLARYRDIGNRVGGIWAYSAPYVVAALVAEVDRLRSAADNEAWEALRQQLEGE